jgi:hypothetical protein
VTTEKILAAMLAESEKQTLLLTEIRKEIETMRCKAAPSSEEMRRRMEEVKGMFAGTPLEMILRGMGAKSNG